MISWLQLNLQKHFRVVFIVLLVAMTFSLIYAIGNQGNFLGGRNDASAELRFFETELNTQAKQQQFARDAQLSAFLSGNMRANPSYQFERATALHIANEHKLPGPNAKQLEEFIKSRPIFMGANGEFDPQSYNMMIDNFKLGGNASEEDIARILTQDYRVNKVYDLLQGPGFVHEDEILDTLRQRNSRYSILTATIDLGSYNPEVEITDEQLQEYYTDFGFNYATPVRRSVEYVEVDAANFVDEVETTEDDLIEYFEANFERYQPTPPTNEEAVVPEPITFEQARSAVRADYRLEKARDVAMEKAIDLVATLIDQEVALGSPALDKNIKAFSLEKKTTPNFSASETPIGTTWGPNIVNQAFLLSKGKFYSEPIQHGNTSIVLFYKNEIASIIPSFDTLRSRITFDYKAEKLRELRVEYGNELKSKLAEIAKDEDAFGAFAEENGMTVANYRDFSLVEPAEGLNQQLLGSVIELDVSEVSDMIKLSENEGVFVYLLSKDTPEVSVEDEQYQQTREGLINVYNRFTTAQYIQKLMTQEAERSRINPFGN